MQRLLQKAFGIYPGEGIKAFRFAKMAIFWALGIMTLETLSDGLFLEKIGSDSLPTAYLTIALLMIGVSSLMIYILRVTSAYRILTTVMGIGACIGTLAAAILFGTPPDWFWSVFKILSRMLFVMLIACSWTFIDQYHDLQDAKRVYSLYSAAFFLGNICSGTIINLILEPLGYSWLLLIAAASLLLALREARQIALKTTPAHDDSTEGVFSSDRSGLSAIARLISRSPYTILLLSLSLLIQLLMTISEFSYMDSFGRFIGGGTEAGEGAIAEFLGRCRAWISACNILMGLFCYSRFVRKLGLNNAILITPLFFVLVYSQWVFNDSLLIAVCGLIAVDGVLFTVEDNSFNLLTNAVPAKLKSKVRIINDSFFEPIGLLLSSLLLLSIQSESRILGCILTVLALAVTLCLRSLYSKALLLNLKENALHFERKVRDWFGSLSRREERESRKDILDALRSPEEELRLLACETLLSINERNVLPQILEVSRAFGTLSKIRLLHLFEASLFTDDPQVLEAIGCWVSESGSPEFCKWGRFYLAKRGIHEESEEDDLEDADPLVRGSSLLALQKDTGQESGLNRAIAAKKIDLMLKSARIDEISIALEILSEGASGGFLKALPLLSHDAVLVKRSAARCVAKLANRNFGAYASRLIEEIESARDNIFRLSCLDALGKIADTSTVKDLLIASVYFRPNERRRTEEIIVQMGLKTVPLLLSLTKDISIPERGRILAGKILGRLALPQLQANLPEVIDVEIDRAYFYFFFGHTIQKQYPLYDLKMLEHALLAGFQSVIDFIIHLLGAAGSIDEPELLVRAIHSPNAKIQSHAVESLEKTCTPRLFARIAPLIDDLPLADRMAACLKHKKDLPQLSLSDLLTILDQSPSLYDKIVAARLKSTLQMPNWRQELREQIKSSDETFHHFAYELLQT